MADKNCHNKQFVTISGVTMSGKHCNLPRGVKVYDDELAPRGFELRLEVRLVLHLVNHLDLLGSSSDHRRGCVWFL